MGCFDTIQNSPLCTVDFIKGQNYEEAVTTRR